MLQLSVRLLGPPQLKCAGLFHETRRRKGFALLAYLAATREPVTRDALATLLWPDCPAERARKALRQALWILRQDGLGDHLEVGRFAIHLPDSDRLSVDVREFRRLAPRIDLANLENERLSTGSLLELSRAVELHRGSFLEGFSLPDSQGFDDWQFFESETLRTELSSAFRRVVRGWAVLGNYRKALGYAQKWASRDPYAEEVHRSILLLHAWIGNRSGVAHRFDRFSARLKEDLDVDPEPETVALYTELMAGRIPERPWAKDATAGIGQEGDRDPPIWRFGTVPIRDD